MSKPNDWQRRPRRSPDEAEPLTCDDLWDEPECPNCRHPLSLHSVDLGCHVGWSKAGLHEDGCTCPLSLALQHEPKREAQVRSDA